VRLYARTSMRSRRHVLPPQDLGRAHVSADIIIHREAILRAVKTRGVAAVSPYKQFVREVGLMSYGPDTVDTFRRTGHQYDNREETRPPGVLAIADEVIELSRRLPVLARLRHADGLFRCPFPGADRK
jgi:hypothetical protein